MIPIIRDIRVICTQPAACRLIVVKVETSEPGLYGLGCATFTQRPLPVVSAVETGLKPLLLGRAVDRIEDIWQIAYQHAYWRNGPVLGNALSGVDMALWDIAGKRANMPVHDLLGGRLRDGAWVYRHADGKSPEQVADKIRAYQAEGVRYVRCQMGGYGGAGSIAADNLPKGSYYDPAAYQRSVIKLFEHLRGELGEELEMLHDVHERLPPSDAVRFAKDLERFRLFFLEDLLAPEDSEWFARVRQVCTTPIAMGELFNNPREWTPLIAARHIDYLRMHISQMGGLTPARKVATMAEQFGVRTAWHAPGDCSPVGHACNLHLDLVSPNFGIQEWCGFNEAVYEVFPGCPVQVDGKLCQPKGGPGWGVDIDEKAAAKYPLDLSTVDVWTQLRKPDGSPARP